MRLLYLYNGNYYTSKTSLYWNYPLWMHTYMSVPFVISDSDNWLSSVWYQVFVSLCGNADLSWIIPINISTRQRSQQSHFRKLYGFHGKVTRVIICHVDMKTFLFYWIFVGYIITLSTWYWYDHIWTTWLIISLASLFEKQGNEFKGI